MAPVERMDTMSDQVTTAKMKISDQNQFSSKQRVMLVKEGKEERGPPSRTNTNVLDPSCPHTLLNITWDKERERYLFHLSQCGPNSLRYWSTKHQPVLLSNVWW